MMSKGVAVLVDRSLGHLAPNHLHHLTSRHTRQDMLNELDVRRETLAQPLASNAPALPAETVGHLQHGLPANSRDLLTQTRDFQKTGHRRDRSTLSNDRIDMD